MALADNLARATRVIERSTLGAIVRAKAARADNQDRIADLVNLRADDRRPLEARDFIEAADELGVEAPALHAVADSETTGRGFDERWRLVPAVECHVFSIETNHAFDRTDPHLSYPEWIPYRKGAPPPPGMLKHPYTMSYDDRWGLFAMQAELNLEAAICALSLGRFQQLVGRTPAMKRKRIPHNWKTLGFPSAEALFRKLATSERAHLEVFILYCRAHGAMRHIRDRNWQAFEDVYNGGGQKGAYARKCADNYKNRTRFYSTMVA